MIPELTVSDGRDTVDLVAVARAIGGDTSVLLRTSDRRWAARILHDEGVSIHRIAAVLHCSGDTVHTLLGETA